MMKTRIVPALGLVSKPRIKASSLLQAIFARHVQTPPKPPLEGLRILELGRVLSVPYATMILGDYGAKIIKVERPGLGDDTRSFGPPFCGGESVYFMSVNRNKKSICIDFKNPKGAEIVKELAKKSDVLIENFMPGKLKEMGLGYEDIKEIAPELVYCSVTGYGQSGPYAGRGGYDVTAAAIGGLMHITGHPDGDPCRVGVAITDITTGLYAHGAILAALFEKQRTGKGKYLDCSLLSSQVAVLSHIAGNYLNADVEATRIGSGHHSIVPYQAFKTKDGSIIVCAANQGQFKALCAKLGMGHIIEDDRFKDNSLRVKNRNIIVPLLQAKLLEQGTDYWLKEFDGAGFPFGSINTMKQVFEDPQVKHLNVVQEIPHPTAGNLRVPGPAVAFDGETQIRKATPPPLLGEHTKEVLQELLNFDDQSISELERDQVIACKI